MPYIVAYATAEKKRKYTYTTFMFMGEQFKGVGITQEESTLNALRKILKNTHLKEKPPFNPSPIST